jgi:Ca-activated chloride channel family protein
VIRGFQWPILLALVPAWLALAAWLARRERDGRARSLAALGSPDVLRAFGAVPSEGAHRRRRLLRTIGIACALAAIARPQGGTASRTGSGAGRDVLVALDLSRSMTVRDVPQDRLALAKQTALDLVLRNLKPGDRAGLVVFGGAGFLQLPLTDDRDAFERFLAAAEVEDLDDPSTNLNAPLETAAAVFEHEGGDGHRALVLLSDGDDEAEHREDAVAALGKLSVPVFSIGIGTATGGYVPRTPEDSASGDPSPWHRDGIGRPIESRLEPDPLREIAAGTGGAYAAWDDAAARQRIVAGLDAITARPLGTQKRTERTEYFQWPLALGVLLLAIECLLDARVVAARRRRKRAAADAHRAAAAAARGIPRLPVAATRAAALLLAALVGCAGGTISLDAGTRHYMAGRHDEALTAWRAALAKSPTPEHHYNVGAALFQLGRYEEAVKEFGDAAAVRGPLQAPALFNLGTAAIRAAEQSDKKVELLERAVASFEQVLALAPGDSTAKWNLEIALRRLADTPTGGSPGRGGRANAGRGDGREEGLNEQRETAVAAMAGGGQGSTEGESAQEIDEQEARRQLDALEREMTSSHEGRTAKKGRRSDRDW